jgi:hypothetical protein
MFSRLVVLFALACIAIVQCAGRVDDSWGNLRIVTKDREYVVVLHDRRCVRGFVSANDQELSVMDGSGSRLIKRDDILRVSDTWGSNARDTVFSGRSSWTDVQDADPRGREYLRVVTTRGEEWTPKQPKVADLFISGDGRTVQKTDVRSVQYVRFVPMTSKEEYVHHENVDLLAPRLWFGGLMMPRINVLLYDSARPEDNSGIACLSDQQ